MRRSISRISLLVNAALLVGCLAIATIFAAPAGAFVAKVGSSKVGLQPREIARYWEGGLKWKGLGKLEAEANPAVLSFNNSSGAPVMHAVHTYAIYWSPEETYYHGDWQGVIDGYLANQGRAGSQLDSVFALDAQYTDSSNHPAAVASAFLGAYTDTNPYPGPEAGCVDPHPFVSGAPLFEETTPVCLTDAQIQRQLTNFIGQHNLHKGMETIFYVLTPPGVAVCLAPGHCSEFEGPIAEIEKDEQEKETKEKKEEVYVEPASYISYKDSFCSYHSAIGTGDANTILYAAIPWTAGGEGDNHLFSVDETPGYDCQDGGFGPGTKPNGELQEKEKEKELSAKEREEFEAKTTKEKREQEEAEELGLQKPHDQEPNQLISTRSPDGGFDTGLADLIVNQIAVEQQNTITDPLLDAWKDSAGSEVTDECRNFFVPDGSGSVTATPETRAGTLGNQSLGSKHYYLNDAFNLASLELPYPAVPCLHDVTLEPQFTVPNPVNAGEVVGFDGMESDITLNAAKKFGEKGEEPSYPVYKWNFGDGSPEVTGFAPGAPSGNPPASVCEEPWLSPCAGSTFHSYEYGGTYQVTLTVTDTGGNTASVTSPVTVTGPTPPPPPPPPGPPGGGGPGSATPGTTPSVTPQVLAPATPTVPGPVASAAAVSSSLKQVAHRGLVVRYAVNEQVAGRFEVLLPAATAHSLGIGGRVATGLPAGYPKSLVIGHALLVTTKGGHSSVRIKFSKRTAKHLRHARKVTLTLRLKVRNACQEPALHHGPEHRRPAPLKASASGLAVLPGQPVLGPLTGPANGVRRSPRWSGCRAASERRRRRCARRCRSASSDRRC